MRIKGIAAAIALLVLALATPGRSTTTSTTLETTTTTSTEPPTTTSTTVTTSTSSTSSSSTSTSSTTTTSTSTTRPDWHNTGTFITSKSTTGASDIVLCFDRVIGAKTLRMEATIASTGTVTLQQRLPGGVTYHSVGTALTATGITSVDNPSGCYRANVTACSGCTVTNVRWEWRH